MDLSVVIPTRNRRARLLATLAALDEQVLDGASAEIVVVDDGSEDGTAAAVGGRSCRLPTRTLSQPRAGASAARNRGIAAATGRVIALLGDDTAPAGRGLLAGHIAVHREKPDPLHAVLGRIAWTPETETPFMRWTEAAGFHVTFDRLRPGMVPTSVHLYSSHTSVKRSTLLDVGGFDESFFFGEDTELGIRLERAGVRLEYRPELLAYHDHPVDLEQFARRMEVVGQAGRMLHERWPDQTPRAVLAPRRSWRLYPLAAAIARALLRVPITSGLRERAWTAVALDAYASGYRGKRSNPG